jgi:transcriptional regulator with XRE-family HTH domain
MFVERVLHLVNKAGITKNKLLTDLELNHNSFGDWKNKKQIPGGETITKIANYFNVQTDYLLCRTDDHTPPANDPDTQEIRMIAREITELDPADRDMLKAFIANARQRRRSGDRK